MIGFNAVITQKSTFESKFDWLFSVLSSLCAMFHLILLYHDKPIKPIKQLGISFHMKMVRSHDNLLSQIIIMHTFEEDIIFKKPNMQSECIIISFSHFYFFYKGSICKTAVLSCFNSVDSNKWLETDNERTVCDT